jgi:hypothetical protein
MTTSPSDPDSSDTTVHRQLLRCLPGIDQTGPARVHTQAIYTQPETAARIRRGYQFVIAANSEFQVIESPTDRVLSHEQESIKC